MTAVTRVLVFRSRGVSKALLHGRTSWLTLVVAAAPALASANSLPTGGTVASGGANISVNGAGTQMTIGQSTDRAIINWSDFSVGLGHGVTINQPNSNSSLLNRVTGSAPSSIAGSIVSNGRVHVVNPNGIFITQSGTIQSGGGFVASTLGISDTDFNLGTLEYNGTGSSAEVRNEGTISVSSGGFVALLGGRVNNSGTVTVPLGRVGFGAGERATLDLTGDGFLQIAIPSTGGGSDPLINNSGTVSSDGGRIEMKAATARNAARHAINLSGIAEARSVAVSNGSIVLGGGDGGRVTVTGEISTRSREVIAPPSAPQTSLRPVARGGNIEIHGQTVELSGAEIDATGTSGGVVSIGATYNGMNSWSLLTDNLTVDGSNVIRSNSLTDQSDIGLDTAAQIALFAEQAASIDGQYFARLKSGNFNQESRMRVESRGSLSFDGIFDGSSTTPQERSGFLELAAPVITLPGTISGERLGENLENGDVTLNTALFNSSGIGLNNRGDIIVNEQISWNANTDLDIEAFNDIFLNAGMTAPNGELDVHAFGLVTNSANSLERGAVFGNVGDIGTIFVNHAADFVLDELQVDFGMFYQNADGGSLGEFSVNAVELFNGNIDRGLTRLVRVQDGIGTEDDPFILVDQLSVAGAFVGGHFTRNANFILNNSIEAAGIDFEDFIESEQVFFGSVDGQGNSISGLRREAEEVDTSQRFGLFHILGDGANIRNLDLLDVEGIARNGGGILADGVHEGATIDNVRVSGRLELDGTTPQVALGGLVGLNLGTITRSAVNVDISGNIDATPTAPFSTVLPNWIEVGGIAGINLGTISQSTSSGSINIINNADATVFIDVGGIAGDHGGDEYFNELIAQVSSTFDPAAANQVIEDSYSLMDITVTDNASAEVSVGGIAGWVTDPIERSFAAGALSGSSPFEVNVGGIAGVAIADADTSTSYFDISVTGASSAAGNGFTDPADAPPAGTGLDTATLQSPTFAQIASENGWDFTNIWSSGNGSSYPTNPAVSFTNVSTPIASAEGAPQPDVLAPFLGEPLSDPDDDLTIFASDEEDGEVDATAAAELSAAQEANEELRNIVAALGRATTDNCDAAAGDVSGLLACVSAGLNDFSQQLDQIALNLPPELASVARIVRDVSADVEAVSQRTTSQLANASTDEERLAIAQAAVVETQTLLDAAAAEVRSAIQLLDADDPALLAEQTETVTLVAGALEDLGSDLVDAADL